MAEIRIVSSLAEIPILPGWHNVEIGSQNTFVTQSGEDFNSSSQGIPYRILSVKGNKFGSIERTARITFGVFITVSSLCLALFSHKIRNLLLETKKKIIYITPINTSTSPLNISIEHVEQIVKKIRKKINANRTTALTPTDLCTITEAKNAYQKELFELHKAKSTGKKNRDKLSKQPSIRSSGKEKKLQNCIHKISKIIQRARLGNTPGAAQNAGNNAAYQSKKKSMLQFYKNDTHTPEFQKLIHYSLQDPSTLSRHDMKAFSRVEGSRNFTAELFFEEHLQNFYRSETLNADEKSTCIRVVKAFEFCKKMGWQAVKARRLNKKSWHKVKAGATFQSAVRNLRSGEEIVFPGIHQAKSEDYGHGTLFAVKKRPEGSYTCSLYNTGLGSSDAPSDKRKKIVDEAHFTADAILSDEFASIVTEELLNCNGWNAVSDSQLFNRYTNFKNRHQIPASAEKSKLIHGQVVGNCSIASQVAYMKEALGSPLFDTFKRFVQRRLHVNRSLVTISHPV